MSRISNGMLETLLEETTDYADLDLSDSEFDELQSICHAWLDVESIESEIKA